MSAGSISPMPEQPGTAKPQRVLACILCQQRKIKCDRKFPCANCLRAGAQCTPAASLAPRQRRRRFPERELLDRLRHYEDLLRQNNVPYEPLHPAAVELPSSSEGRADSASLDGVASEDTLSGRSSDKAATTAKPESVSLWHAIGTRGLNPEQDNVNDDDDDDEEEEEAARVDRYGPVLHDSDDVREALFRKAWDRTFESNNSDHLLLGSPETNEDLSTLHPEQVQIFKLWQIYLENVDPLLKVTHAPTLQVRIIEAVSNIENISPPLEALIFSIYCISILSLDEDECAERFGHSMKELLTRYQFGCRQALRKARVLRTSDLDCLTALYLYLLSTRPEIDPRSLSSMLGMTIRIAKRIGIQNESSCNRCPPLQAELRRRLWWSLVVFDNRICEMFDYQNSTLTPIWDCGAPANVNDFEVRPEMKTPPMIHENPTEAVFTVVRSEISDFIRHSAFHLDFVNPDQKAREKGAPADSLPAEDGLSSLARIIEEKYLARCNPENPLQFMTIWSSRGYIAKTCLLNYYSRHSTSSAPQTDAQRNTIGSYALTMLECDTTLRTSPLTKGFQWFTEFNFPFPAYMHLLQNLKRRPCEDYADKAWKLMSDNYETRIMNFKDHGVPLLAIFSRMVLQAWQSREIVFKQSDKSPTQPPMMVSALRSRLKSPHQGSVQTNDVEQRIGAPDVNDNISVLTPMGLKSFHDNEMRSLTDAGFWNYPNNSQQSTTDIEMDQFDWNAMDWNLINLDGL